jgi:hypothetical protein
VRFHGGHNLISAVVAAGDRLQIEVFNEGDKSWKPGLPFEHSAGLGDGSKLGTGCCGDLAVGGAFAVTPATIYVIAPLVGGKSDQTHALYCTERLGAEPNAWKPATGLVDPARVWASDGDSHWAYVYDNDPVNRGIYVTRDGACQWKRDDLASLLADEGGLFSPVRDPLGYYGGPVSAAGFDPGRPGRAAIGTVRGGILITPNYGASWAVSHAFPEPNGGPRTIYFDDSGLPSGTLEATHVAGWGRGVWAVKPASSVSRCHAVRYQSERRCTSMPRCSTSWGEVCRAPTSGSSSTAPAATTCLRRRRPPIRTAD